LEIASLGTTLQVSRRDGSEKYRPRSGQQVVVFVARLSVGFEQTPVAYGVVAKGGFEIEFGANGISRGGVVFAQLKLGIRAVSSTGAPDE
jgi:hypothetical protein